MTTDLQPATWTEALATNRCMACGEPLRGADGVFYSRMDTYRRIVMAVCAGCRKASA